MLKKIIPLAVAATMAATLGTKTFGAKEEKITEVLKIPTNVGPETGPKTPQLSEVMEDREINVDISKLSQDLQKRLSGYTKNEGLVTDEDKKNIISFLKEAQKIQAKKDESKAGKRADVYDYFEDYYLPSTITVRQHGVTIATFQVGVDYRGTNKDGTSSATNLFVHSITAGESPTDGEVIGKVLYIMMPSRELSEEEKLDTMNPITREYLYGGSEFGTYHARQEGLLFTGDAVKGGETATYLTDGSTTYDFFARTTIDSSDVVEMAQSERRNIDATYLPSKITHVFRSIISGDFSNLTKTDIENLREYEFGEEYKHHSDGYAFVIILDGQPYYISTNDDGDGKRFINARVSGKPYVYLLMDDVLDIVTYDDENKKTPVTLNLQD